MKTFLIKDLISDKISGEWGIDPVSDKCVRVIRSTNFTKEGKLKLSNVVERDISDAKVQQKKLKLGDIIIEKSGGSPSQPVGRVVFFDVDDGKTYLCNNFTSILRPSEKVFPKYLFYSLYYLHLKNKTLNYQNKTTGIINLQLDRYIKSERVSLPILEDQKRIVKILDEADALRQKRKQAIELLGDYLKSVFSEMFGDLRINSKKLEVSKMEDIAEINMGQSPKGDSYNCLAEGVPLLNGPTEFGDKYPKEKQWTTDPKKFCKFNDILFCVRGATAGRMNWADKKYSIGRGLCAIRPRNNIISRTFLYVFLSQMYDVFQSTSNGSTFINIDKKRLNNLIVPVDPEKSIVFEKAFLRVESLKQIMLAQSEELETQFQALMQRCFG